MSSKLKLSPGTKAKTREKFKKTALRFADQVTSSFMRTLLTEMPVESGHAHESFIKAAERTSQLPETTRAALQFYSSASNDPIAASNSISDVKATQLSVSVTLGTKLPFVRKLEYGLPITVGDLSGNKGKKAAGGDGRPINSPGSLYSPRYGGDGGMLMWREGGQVRFAKVRIPSGASTGFFKKAMIAAKQAANTINNSKGG